MKMLCGVLLLCLVSCPVYLWANENAALGAEQSAQQKKQLKSILSHLQINQGIATFTQKKQLSFLNKPIVSKGFLKIYQNRVIWQVQSPVFSKLVIIDDQVWQLTDKHASSYQLLVSNASVETLIRAIFTGDINQSQWHILIDEQQCLQLSPKDLILSQSISYISVCVSDNQAERFVRIKDTQNNVTEIVLNITTSQLSDENIREFDIFP